MTPPVSTDPASLSARQELLAAQLAALEQRGAAITGAAANAYGNATRAEGLLVALAARRQINRGLPLGYLEQQLRDRFGATQPGEVTTIVAASREPVTTEDLRLGLDQIGPQLALGPSGSAGWGGAVVRLLGSLIVVHPRNTPSPVPSERLARVRRMLAQDQVEAAVEEVNKLPGASQATGWMTGAKRYVDTRKALNVLEAAALQGRVATPATLGVPSPRPLDAGDQRLRRGGRADLGARDHEDERVARLSSAADRPDIGQPRPAPLPAAQPFATFAQRSSAAGE